MWEMYFAGSHGAASGFAGMANQPVIPLAMFDGI
jgi:hypothetical protein